jgi:hypothetical protein
MKADYVYNVRKEVRFGNQRDAAIVLAQRGGFVIDGH